jgi:hypothetical protein
MPGLTEIPGAERATVQGHPGGVAFRVDYGLADYRSAETNNLGTLTRPD